MKESVNVAVSSATQMVEHERLGKRTCWTICQHLFSGRFAWTDRIQRGSHTHANLVREGSERISRDPRPATEGMTFTFTGKNRPDGFLLC